MKMENELIAHIEKYEQHPLVKPVLLGKTTFQKEVEDYYNLCVNYVDCFFRYGPFKKGYKNKTKKSKKPENPMTDLFEILSKFSKYPLDPRRLDWDLVRNEFERKELPFRTFVRSIINSFRGLPEPKITGYAYKEFDIFYSSAISADNFIQIHYQNLLVNRALEI